MFATIPPPDLGESGGIFFGPPNGHRGMMFLNAVMTRRENKILVGFLYLTNPKNSAILPPAPQRGIMHTINGKRFLVKLHELLSEKIGDEIRPPGGDVHFVERITALDLYYAFRTMRDYFRANTNAFPWEFNQDSVTDWTIEDVAEALIEIFILVRSGHLPPHKRFKPKDIHSSEHDAENFFRFAALLQGFVNVLNGAPFAEVYEDALEKARALWLSSQIRNAIALLPVNSFAQVKMAMGLTSKFRSGQDAEFLIAFLKQEFGERIKSGETIPDKEFETAIGEFQRTVLAATAQA